MTGLHDDSSTHFAWRSHKPSISPVGVPYPSRYPGHSRLLDLYRWYHDSHWVVYVKPVLRSPNASSSSLCEYSTTSCVHFVSQIPPCHPSRSSPPLSHHLFPFFFFPFAAPPPVPACCVCCTGVDSAAGASIISSSSSFLTPLPLSSTFNPAIRLPNGPPSMEINLPTSAAFVVWYFNATPLTGQYVLSSSVARGGSAVGSGRGWFASESFWIADLDRGRRAGVLV